MGSHHRLVVRTASVLAMGPGIASPPCAAHRCAEHPHNGPLCYLLSTAGTVPAELYPALQTHRRGHHGDLALLAP